MDKFLDLLRESVIVQGVLTLSLAGAVIYLCCTGQDVPDLLQWAFSIALGYYFGSKVQQLINRV